MILLVVDEGSRSEVTAALNIAKEYSDLSHLEVLDLEKFGEDGIYYDSDDPPMDGLSIDEIKDKGKLVAVLDSEELDSWITDYTNDFFEADDSGTIAQWLVDVLPRLDDGSTDDETEAMAGSGS